MDATLLTDLVGHFTQPEEGLPAARFQELALRVFRHQYRRNPVYRRYCQGRLRTPDTVSNWREVPPVPATAFKRLDLFSGDPASPGEKAGLGEPEALFLTSGTTAGPGRRGRHPVLSLELYRATSVAWFGMHLVPEGGRLPVLSLVPSPGAAPTSSLSTMMGFAVQAFGSPGSDFLADPETGIRAALVAERFQAAEAEGAPVLLMGTAFAWVHWLEAAEAGGWRFRMPEGSRLMETGGFKGRSRTVSRPELYRALRDRLGVPVERMVNEYGMTELLSQLYEPVLSGGSRGNDWSDPETERYHSAPPWLGVQVLDPDTLAPRPAGEPGILSFFDLGNVGSVSAVLTEDVGILDRHGGLHLQGRAAGAEPRGCSLAMESLMEGRS